MPASLSNESHQTWSHNTTPPHINYSTAKKLKKYIYVGPILFSSEFTLSQQIPMSLSPIDPWVRGQIIVNMATAGPKKNNLPLHFLATVLSSFRNLVGAIKLDGPASRVYTGLCPDFKWLVLDRIISLPKTS